MRNKRYVSKRLCHRLTHYIHPPVTPILLQGLEDSAIRLQTYSSSAQQKFCIVCINQLSIKFLKGTKNKQITTVMLWLSFTLFNRITWGMTRLWLGGRVCPWLHNCCLSKLRTSMLNHRYHAMTYLDLMSIICGLEYWYI